VRDSEFYLTRAIAIICPIAPLFASTWRSLSSV